MLQRLENYPGLKFVLSLVLIVIWLSAGAQINRRNTKKSVTYKSAYQRVSAGDEHAVEIRDGALWAWGRNQYGQIGDGTTVMRTSPVQVGTLTTWVSVDAGGEYNLAIKADGTLWSWGGNSYGSLGDGTTIGKTFPVQVGTASNWISVSAGDRSSYGIRSDGTLWAWGWNAYGQLGDGTTTQRNSPVQIGSGTTWVKVSAGYSHVVALKADGTLWAWGDNSNGQLGDGTLTNRLAPVQIGTATNYTSIAAAYSWTSALRSDGTLWAWGDNGAGSLGDGTTTQRTAPVQIGTATDWVSISVASFTSLALKSNGTLWAWGENGFGTMGNGTITSSYFPVQIGTDNNWVMADGGGWFAVGVKSDGTIRTWGRNNYGQVGNGTSGTQENNQVQIGVTLKGWLATSGGWKHTVAVKENGTLWGWGDNSAGQVGDGTTTQRHNPVQIGTGTSWVSAIAGYNFSFALKSDGTLWAWGDNTYGQLGDGTVISKSSPVQVGTSSDWVTISAGQYHAFGLKSNGTLWAWGRNQFGTLGDGTSTQRTSPVQIGTSTLWTSISSGSMHTLALRANGTLWAWGYNFYSPLGNGSSSDSNVPIQIGVATNWVSISANMEHSHGLRSDGTMYGWGRNTSYQLGDGTITLRNVPTQIGIATTWLSLAAGYNHTLGLKADGTYWNWGSNSSGELGDGTFTSRTTPGQLGTVNNWVYIGGGVGNIHSLLIKSERNEYCYSGYNGQGQLGNCSTTNVNVLACLGLQPVVTAEPINVSICPGGNATFTIAADNASTYQWQENGVNITTGAYTGFTTNSLTVISAGAGMSGNTYRCIVSTSGGCPPPDTSVAAVLTIYSLPPVSATASPSASVCSGQSVTLNGAGASTYTWSSGVSNGVTFTPSSTTTYTVTGTDVNGCQNISNITITVNSLPTIGSTVSPSATVCSGSSTILNGSGGVSYTWTGGVTNGVAFFPTTTTTYTVTGTDGNGCQNTATRIVTVNPLPSVTANASPSASICMGQIVTLNGGGASSYTWSGGAGGIINGVGFQPLSTATYTVNGTDGNGCQNTNTITVTVNSLPTVSSSASPSTTICDGQSVTLTGAGASSYTWTGGVFNGVAFTPGASATYTVTGTDANGCQNTSSKTIVVNSLPIVTTNVSPSNIVCYGQNITLSGSGASSYSWSGGVTNGVPFSPPASATYTVTGTDANGCQNTATRSITVNSLPVISSVVSSDTICSGSSTVLTASGGNSYLWSANAGSSTSASVSVSPPVTTTYTVTGTDLNSCSNTSTLTVNVLVAAAPQICLVTVDSALSNHNIIYWDKSGIPSSVDSFRIYREVTTAVYAYVASVHADSLSEYHDYSADPNVTSYKYKLSVIDSCGNESSMSDYHSTIHLQNLGSGNLQWTLYEIEPGINPVVYYRVLRDDAGTGCCFLPISSTIPGGNSTYTDVAYASFPNADYRVDVTWGISCTPTRATVNTSRSNIKKHALSIGVSENESVETFVTVYPNPANGTVLVSWNQPAGDAKITIMNAVGQLTKEISVSASAGGNMQKQVDISDLPKGVYTITIEYTGVKVHRKLVVN
jgi:alpha-tubulin suppressor-like RCC1 family protein